MRILNSALSPGTAECFFPTVSPDELPAYLPHRPKSASGTTEGASVSRILLLRFWRGGEMSRNGPNNSVVQNIR